MTKKLNEINEIINYFIFFLPVSQALFFTKESSEILWSFFAEIVNGFNYFRKKAPS